MVFCSCYICDSTCVCVCTGVLSLVSVTALVFPYVCISVVLLAFLTVLCISILLLAFVICTSGLNGAFACVCTSVYQVDYTVFSLANTLRLRACL